MRAALVFMEQEKSRGGKFPVLGLAKRRQLGREKSITDDEAFSGESHSESVDIASFMKCRDGSSEVSSPDTNLVHEGLEVDEVTVELMLRQGPQNIGSKFAWRHGRDPILDLNRCTESCIDFRGGAAASISPTTLLAPFLFPRAAKLAQIHPLAINLDFARREGAAARIEANPMRFLLEHRRSKKYLLGTS